MRLHPRYFIVTKASIDFSTMLIEFNKSHPDLTYLELLGIINERMGNEIKYAIRQERHPDDPEKKGDEE